jgi:hypothetical protein
MSCETAGFPFSAPFRPPTASAATVVSLAVVIQGITEPVELLVTGKPNQCA